MSDDTLTTQQVASETPPQKKRRKRGTGKTQNMYFNDDTRKAILDYQNTQDRRERERLYLSFILPAFEKLAENLINIYKFSGIHDSTDDLKTDCVSFLFETILKFDHTRGTNAFSYFNVVAKNWLIVKTKQKVLKTKKSISLDDIHAISIADSKYIEEQYIERSQEEVIEEVHNGVVLIELLAEMHQDAKNEDEKAALQALITIFENADNVDILGKNALLLYVKELSGLKTKQLNTVMQSIKAQFKILREFVINGDY